VPLWAEVGRAVSGRRAAARFVPTMAGVRDLTKPAATIGYSQTLSLGYSTGDEAAGALVAGELDLAPQVSLTLGLDHGFALVPNGVSLTAAASDTVHWKFC
jgi:hypothetical protein